MSTAAAPSPGWYRVDGDNLILSVYAQPGAKRTEVHGLHGTEGEMRLKIRVAAPPLEGRANDEIRRFLADALQVPLRDVTMLAGEKSRNKRFAVCGARVDALRLFAIVPFAPP